MGSGAMSLMSNQCTADGGFLGQEIFDDREPSYQLCPIVFLVLALIALASSFVYCGLLPLIECIDSVHSLGLLIYLFLFSNLSFSSVRRWFPNEYKCRKKAAQRGNSGMLE